jgi:aminodeoxyfutalosine deaminase
MILRARTVVTMDGPPIENGAVRVRGDRILEVGESSRLASSNDEIVDLGEHILLPGLINAHCHLDYTCLRGKIAPPQSFADWIRAINAEKAKLSAEDYVVSINQGLAEAKQFGTTAIANLTAFPELIAKTDEPIWAWWFAELIDVRNRAQNLTALSCQVSGVNGIVNRALEQLSAANQRGFAPHAPFTASANLYRCCEEIAQREKIFLTTHLAESREEMQMFREANGPLYDFLKEIGRDMSDCGGTTPLSRFANLTDASAAQDWIVAHLNEVSEILNRALPTQPCLFRAHRFPIREAARARFQHLPGHGQSCEQ